MAIDTTATAVIAALAGGTGAFLGASLSALLGERGRLRNTAGNNNVPMPQWPAR